MSLKGGLERKDDYDSSPMFSLRRLDWEKRLSKLTNSKGKNRYIQKIAAASNILFIGVSGGSLVRWKLNDLSKEPEEIEISTRSDDVIEQVFVDPAGFHTIIAFKSGDSFYLHSKAAKAKKMSKFQGNIEAVAFDRNGVSESSTKSMLIGTSLGCLYEVIVENSGKEKLFQLIHQINPPIPINSVFFESVIPGGSAGEALNSATSDRQYVLFSTDSPTRLYHLVGSGSLHQVFNEYNQGSEVPFIELPGEIHKAELLCFSKSPSARAETFALLTGAGIYHGSLKEIRSGSDNLLTETHILPFIEPVTRNPHFQYEIEGVSRKPLAISTSTFHFVLLRGDRLQFQSTLNGDLIQEEPFRSSDGIPIDLIRDAARNTSYLYTNGSIFQIIAHEEDRDVWSTFLAKALATGDDSLFDLAFEHSKTAERKSAVTKARAEFYFKEQKYEKAAVYYAHSGLNFEEVTLKLISVNENLAVMERSPLQPVSKSEIDPTTPQGSGKFLWLCNHVNVAPVRIYLIELLKLLPASSKSQRTILCTWVCEIYLHEITENALSAAKGRPDLTSEFNLFLKANKNSLDFATILQLIIHRNNRKLLLFYARIMGDYHRVINMLLTEKHYEEALHVVQDAPFEKIANFIYKVMPIFFETVPERTVNILISKPNFQIPNLVPAILRYCVKYDQLYYSKQSITRADSPFSTEVNFAVTCLEEFLRKAGLNFEHCPDRIDVSVHETAVDLNENINVDEWAKSETEAIALHLMCHLYAKYDESKAERKIMKFLHTLLNLQELCVLMEFVDVDLEYMLRQCRVYQRKRGAVYCLLLLKEFKQAVAEALVVDLDLAKAVTRRQEDALLRKDLWIMIAIHLINNDNDVKKVISLVKESNEDVLIEDLLPFLPDFTEIDNFRDDICKSLEACSSRINNVKADMQHLLETAENTMQELESMKNRGYSTRSNHERCDLCSEGLMGHQFYLFPCSHGFHGGCLLKEAYKTLNADHLVTLKSLEDSLKTLASRGKDLDNRSRAQQEALQQELDSYIAADCPLCGYAMINSITASLISPDENQQAKLWSL